MIKMGGIALKKRLSWISVCLLVLFSAAGMLFSTAAKTDTSSHKAHTEAQVINTFDGVADYLQTYHKLPDNYITKSEAQALGWVASKGNLADVAPGKSIGGDIFSNREGKLPAKSGRTWREADINYTSGFRNSDRILYSSDWLIYKTTDHYKTFIKMR